MINPPLNFFSRRTLSSVTSTSSFRASIPCHFFTLLLALYDQPSPDLLLPQKNLFRNIRIHFHPIDSQPFFYFPEHIRPVFTLSPLSSQLLTKTSDASYPLKALVFDPSNLPFSAASYHKNKFDR